MRAILVVCTLFICQAILGGSANFELAMSDGTKTLLILAFGMGLWADIVEFFRSK